MKFKGESDWGHDRGYDVRVWEFKFWEKFLKISGKFPEYDISGFSICKQIQGY